MDTKGSEAFESLRCKIGVAFTQGEICNMQDRYSIELDKIFARPDPVDYIAVISGIGHDADTASLFVASNLNELVMEHILKGTTFLKAIEHACIELDERLMRAATTVDPTGKVFNDSGATLGAMWIHAGKIFCANVGDCRVVVSHNRTAVAITNDHVPDNPAERGRIVNAGGHVYGNKIDYKISVSRAFGLFSYKQRAYGKSLQQVVIPLPSVYEVDMDPNLDFFVLASGSVFEVLSNQQVVTFVLEQMKSCLSLQDTAQQLMDWCATLWRNTMPKGHTGMGNLTCIIVTLSPAAYCNQGRTSRLSRGVSRLTNSSCGSLSRPPQPFMRTSRLTNSRAGMSSAGTGPRVSRAISRKLP